MKKAWNIILFILFFTVLSFLALGIFRGFEITDEGFYLLMYEKPELYNSLSRYFIIVSKLFSGLNFKIYHYRFVALLINLLGSYFFFTGLWQYLNTKIDLNSKTWSKLSAFLFITMGSFTAFFLLYKVIGYNDINNFLILSATGAVFCYLANPERKILSPIMLLLTGFILVFDIMVKFPAGIAYTGLLMLFLSIERKSFSYLKFLLPGVLLGILIYFTFFESPTLLINSIKAAIKVNEGGSHSLKHVFGIYIFSINQTLWLFSFYIFPLIVFIITLLSYRFKKYKYTYIFGFIAFYLFLSSCIVFSPLSGKITALATLPAFLTVIIFQSVFLLFIKNNNGNSKIIPLISFLFLLPFTMAFGTGASITMMAYLHMAPLFAVFFILNLLSEKPNLYIKTVNIFFSFVFIAFYLLHFYFLYIKNPFRLNDSFFAQKYKIENIKKLEHLKVDKNTKIFLEGLNKLMKEADFKKDDYLIGYFMPGIVYTFDGISPGATYYDPHLGSVRKNINAIVKSENILDETYFLLPENCIFDICTYMKDKDILKNHKIVGKIENPYKPAILEKSNMPNSPLLLYKPPKEK